MLFVAFPVCTGSNRPLLLIIVYPNEGGVAGYGNRTKVKYTAKWGLQIAKMIFQTRSSTSFPHFYIKATNMPRGILLYRAAAYCKIKIGPLDDY